MKLSKKIISLVLAFVMIFSMSAVAFAADSTKFVLIGDSIAFGSGLTDRNVTSYGVLVSDINGYSYENYSIPGHTTFNLLERLENADVVAGVKSADIIGISIGGNNFLLGGIGEMIIQGVLYNNYDKMNKIAEELNSQLRTIITKVSELNPDAQILVQTLYNPRTDFRKETYEYGVRKLNAIIKDLEQETGKFAVVDVYSAFNGKAGLIQPDITHPNEEGHYIIASEYVKVLYELGLGTAQNLPEFIPEEERMNFFMRLVTKIKSLIEEFFSLF